MAFKENKDGISIDKGVATESEISSAISELDSTVSLAVEDLVDNLAQTDINHANLNSTVFWNNVNTNNALATKAGVIPAIGTISGLQVSTINRTATKTAGLAMGSDASQNSSNIYSIDGREWSANNSTPSTSAPWVAGAYGNGRFVLIAGQRFSSATTAYSTNGITWTIASMPSSQRWSSIAYGVDKFVAIAGASYNNGLNSTVSAYSTDGITWTASTMPSSQRWSSIAYGVDKFVAIAGDHTSNTNAAAYSTDGITWTASTMPASVPWSSVTYGVDKFVAISGNQSSRNTAAYSTDGITWTASTMPSSSTWSSVTYGVDKFVAIAGFRNFSNAAAYSTDGITWTASTMPSSRLRTSVAFVNDAFIAVGLDAFAAYSTNGITWGEVPVNSFSTNHRAIVVGQVSGPMALRAASEDYVNAAIAAAIAAL
jgi:hypothetical protein